MRYELLLTEDAERDLDDIYNYIAEFDSKQNADHVLDRLLEAADQLAASPDRGSTPKELQSLGAHEYRQVFFKPYRVIYRALDAQVIIYVIVDGRHDSQSLLTRRLLG